jgi:hypothetical protein
MLFFDRRSARRPLTYTHTHSSHTREKQPFFSVVTALTCARALRTTAAATTRDRISRKSFNQRRATTIDERAREATRLRRSETRGEGGGASAPERRTVTAPPEHHTNRHANQSIKRAMSQSMRASTSSSRRKVVRRVVVRRVVVRRVAVRRLRRRRARSIGASRIATPF